MESAAAGLDGGQLTTTYLVNVGDRGVDAGLRRAAGTRYIPEGDSAWQFKAGDWGPSACKTELRGASAALEVLRTGGTYRLVLGADLNDSRVRRRRQALEEEATALGIEVRPGMFEVLNASDLADWAEQHPALAMSPLLGGIDNVAQPFAVWAASNQFAGPWVDAPSRERLGRKVQGFVTDGGRVGLHIEGVSGLGKTRAVLEAIRGQDFEPLVAYVYAADALPAPLIHHLQAQARHTVLVVDECGAERHEVLAQQLPDGSAVKLITIGESAGYRPLAAPVDVEPLEKDALREVITQNQPALWQEHVGFVVDASAGNVRLALLLADAIVKQPTTTAHDLLTPDIIKSYVAQTLPTGTQFLACCVLALLSSFGYDGEPAGELGILATAFEFNIADLRAAARSLKDAGLLSVQGRYRSVTPHPLAIYLAARGWEDLHDQIESRLLQVIDESMTERLFQRAADVGDLPAIGYTVQRLLGPGGRYEALDVWAGGSLTLYLAALAPQAVCGRVQAVLAAMSDEELRTHVGHRQALVWTIEKLGWRPVTFRCAADALLRLTAAGLDSGPDEDPAGRSWTDLFGTLLPATAAVPTVRLEYLRDVTTAADRRHRLLAVTAAGRALEGNEWVVASAEAQGGVLVERRGRPATWGDAYTYLENMIDLLSILAHDADPEVADNATSDLVDAIHPLLTAAARVRNRLAGVVASLPEVGLTAARTQVTHLEALFDRVGGNADNDIEARRQGLEEFAAQLPAPTPEQTLEALANARRWDFPEGEFQRKIAEAAAAVSAAERVPRLLSVLDGRSEAAYEIGHAIADLVRDDHEARERLIVLAGEGRPAALTGYLYARVESGIGDAFDQLLDSEASDVLGDATRLAVTVGGPQGDAGWARVAILIPRLSPRQGVQCLYGWHVDLDPERLRAFLAHWLPRVDTQHDYNIIVDFVANAMRSRPEGTGALDPLIAELVALRARFGQLDTMTDADWEDLARRQLAAQPGALLGVLLDLVATGGYRLRTEPDGSSLLRDTVVGAGADGWRETMTRLETGNSYFRAAARRWLGIATDVDTAQAWIGDNIERARLVASVTALGYDQLHPIARFLIRAFGSDEQVADSLRAALLPRLGFGPLAPRVQQVIEQVANWADTNDESGEVATWIRTTLDWLKSAQEYAAQRDEELP